MRPTLLLPAVPLLLQAAPPTPVPLEEAHTRLLEAYDEDPSPQKLPSIPVKGKDRPAQAWLLAALRETAPGNPFSKGGWSHQEAESLRALLASPREGRADRLKALPLALAGTQAALWRWGQALARRGELPVALRRAWEDRLLQPAISPVIRGWAMRHAFCFALAEADETRLGELKEACAKDDPELVQQFQRAFALLGGPPPRIYLWSLPELEALDTPLGRLGSRLHISPLEPGAAPPPAGCAWIIPAMTSNLAASLSSLEGPSLEEARRISDTLRPLGRKAYLAPSREPFVACALAFFPIDIRLDGAGLIQSIRMGDAALADQAKPTP